MLTTSAKTKLYIGAIATVEPANAAAYEATHFVQVGEIETLGEFGDTANTIDFIALADSRKRKFKGSRDAGSIKLGLGRDGGDLGQIAIKAALNTDFDYTFKVELPDHGPNSPQHGTLFYFIGKVMSYTTDVGSADQIVKSNAEIGINSDILEITAV